MLSSSASAPAAPAQNGQVPAWAGVQQVLSLQGELRLAHPAARQRDAQLGQVYHGQPAQRRVFGPQALPGAAV